MTTNNNSLAKRLDLANKKLTMALQHESPMEAETALVMMVQDLRQMEVGPHDVALVVKDVTEMMDRCLVVLQRDSDLCSQNLELIRQMAVLKAENLTLKHRVALLEAAPPPTRRKKGEPTETIKPKRKKQQLGRESEHRSLLEVIARHEDGTPYEHLRSEVPGFWSDARLYELTALEYGEPALVAVPRPDHERPIYRITEFGRRLLET